MSRTEPDLPALFEKALDPGAADYGANIQNLCEQYWPLLEDEDSPACNREYMEKFTDMLQDDERLDLARLVVADLRIGAPPASNDRKRQVQHQLLHRQVEVEFNKTREERNRLFNEENQILQEVDLYKAGILLFNRGTLSEAEKAEVRDWLKKAPSFQNFHTA